MIDSGQLLFKKIVYALRRSFFFLLLFSICINLLMLAVPIYMLEIYDYVLNSHSFDTLIYLSLITVFALLILAALDLARSRILTVVGGWLDVNLSPRALEKSADEILQGRNYGGQSLRDVKEIKTFVSSPAIFALFDSPWVPIYIIVIFLMHPLLGFISLVGAIMLFGMAILNEVLTRKLMLEANQHLLISQRHVDHSLNNAEVIQAMGMMPAIIDHWHKKNDRGMQLQYLINKRVGTISSISKFLRLFFQVLMLGAGAFLVIIEGVTPGVMIAGTILLARALAPVEQSITVWKQLQSSRQAYQRLKAHFANSHLRSAGIQLPKPTGVLQLNDVYFGFPQTQKPVLSKLSMAIKPGEMLAIIGPSGSGKSTLARLMVGVLKPNIGHVRLDGADVYTWDRPDFGKHIGYLPQEPQLFSGTIKENIARLQEPIDEEVIKASQLANAHALILKFPMGYDTEINTGHFNLSGGQTQRIALARALYQEPQLIVLDEPNAHLDKEGDLALTQTLLKLKEMGKTIIVISHRSSILKHTDTIALLMDGELKLLGPRDDVLDKLKNITAQKMANTQNRKP